MGFLARQQPRPQQQTPPDEQVFIFLRSSDLSTTVKPAWSLAVLQNEQAPPSPVVGYGQQQKQKKQLFSFSGRRDSAIDMTPTFQPLSRTTSRRQPVLHEFALCSGRVKRTHHTTMTSPAHHAAMMTSKSKSGSILLQILLPYMDTTQTSSQLLVPQIEEVLHRVTTSNSNFTLSSETWLKLCLIALQSDNLIPSMNVERCTTYARNAFTGFEGECLREGSQRNLERIERERRLSTSSTDPASGAASMDLGARYTKVVDFAEHVRENERLRALFGHQHEGTAAAADTSVTSHYVSTSSGSSNDGNGNGNGIGGRSPVLSVYQTVTGRSPGGGNGGNNTVRKAYNRLSGMKLSSGYGAGDSRTSSSGSWWAATTPTPEGRGRDVYAGLM